ncbi:MAG: hypothetical protein LBT38_11870 [Deltaproteobacteria bacterium]|jgi:hypothetical protein|nr:hypothetical protein [Deltaproteobacteria bacterium]
MDFNNEFRLVNVIHKTFDYIIKNKYFLIGCFLFIYLLHKITIKYLLGINYCPLCFGYSVLLSIYKIPFAVYFGFHYTFIALQYDFITFLILTSFICYQVNKKIYLQSTKLINVKFKILHYVKKIFIYMVFLKIISTVVFSILYYEKFITNFLEPNSIFNLFIYYNIYIFIVILTYTPFSLTIPILTKEDISLVKSIKKSFKHTTKYNIYIRTSLLFYFLTLLFWCLFLIILVIIDFDYFSRTGIYEIIDLLTKRIKVTEYVFELFYYLSTLLLTFLALIIHIVSVIIYKELSICQNKTDPIV